MSTSKAIAVVLPAYKSAFLREAVVSLVRELGDDTHLYIFDDCSPHNLLAEVEDLLTADAITYYRFPENMGEKNLAGHWNRCIDRTAGEPWIWLFSDDDKVTQGTLREAQLAIKDAAPTDILCMDIQFIDKNGCPTGELHSPPSSEGPDEYALNRLLGRRKVFAADHIFSRKTYESAGKFMELPAAWYSDELTWHKMASIRKGRFVKINNAVMQFRMSGENISTSRRHQKSKQRAQIIAHRYWREHFPPSDIARKRAFATWRQLGMLAAGINPLSLHAWLHLKQMNLSNREMIFDIFKATTIRVAVILRILTKRFAGFR